MAEVLPCAPPQTPSAEAGPFQAAAALRLGNLQRPARSQEAVAWAGVSLGTQERGWKVLKATKNRLRPRCWRGPRCGVGDEEGRQEEKLGGCRCVSLLNEAAPLCTPRPHLGLRGGHPVGSSAQTLRVCLCKQSSRKSGSGRDSPGRRLASYSPGCTSSASAIS